MLPLLDLKKSVASLPKINATTLQSKRETSPAYINNPYHNSHNESLEKKLITTSNSHGKFRYKSNGIMIWNGIGGVGVQDSDNQTRGGLKPQRHSQILI